MARVQMTKQQTADFARALLQAIRAAELELEQEALERVIRGGLPVTGIPGAIMALTLAEVEKARMKDEDEDRLMVQYFEKINVVLKSVGEQTIGDEVIEEALGQFKSAGDAVRDKRTKKREEVGTRSGGDDSGGKYDLSSGIFTKLPVN